MAETTPRDRVANALNHEERDREPRDLGRGPASGISGEAYGALVDHLGVTGEAGEIQIDHRRQTAFPGEARPG